MHQMFYLLVECQMGKSIRGIDAQIENDQLRERVLLTKPKEKPRNTKKFCLKKEKKVDEGSLLVSCSTKYTNQHYSRQP